VSLSSVIFKIKAPKVSCIKGVFTKMSGKGIKQVVPYREYKAVLRIL